MPPSATTKAVASMLGMTTIEQGLAGRRVISASLRRALQIRIAALEQEQDADILQFGRLYAFSDELFFRNH